MARTSSLTETLSRTEKRLDNLEPEDFTTVMFKGQLSQASRQFIVDNIKVDCAVIDIGVGFIPDIDIVKIYQDDQCSLYVHDKRPELLREKDKKTPLSELVQLRNRREEILRARHDVNDLTKETTTKQS